ncbi:hypothetical protein SAMN05444166_2405 [Singulisphaera sp. GP187]|nr:hypothetical protein SAMN05444166_2405 [Singulisphaera sp. GP187]
MDSTNQMADFGQEVGHLLLAPLTRDEAHSAGDDGRDDVHRLFRQPGLRIAFRRDGGADQKGDPDDTQHEDVNSQAELPLVSLLRFVHAKLVVSFGFFPC